VVYRAYDTDLQQEIALKTLHAVTADREQQLKFEFRVLRGITHPNLVQLYDLVVEQDEAFFTMELVEGADLISAIRGGAPPLAPLDADGLARLRALFGQLTVCLAALHAHGRVHRDLKPENIMVTHAGDLRLLDFGFAAVVRAHAADEDLTIAGTVPYMAPEQIWGVPPAPAMDWYSVGALLWEALAGVACFDGSPATILRLKEHGPIPDVRERVPVASGELATLAHLLLDPDPANRPDATTIAAVLAGRQSALAVPAPPRPAPTYVGRAGELATLADWLAAVAGGAPCIGHVVGASGIGKTALGRHFAAQAADALVLWSRCHSQETVPFKALDGAIDSLARHLRRDAAAAELLAAVDVAALADVFPALAPPGAVAAPPPTGLDARERRRRGFAALRGLIAALTRQRPLVLWIDDAQWGDRDSAQALLEVLRGPAAPRLLLILAYRGEESATAPLVVEMARADGVVVSRLDLVPLPLAQARALAAAWTGRPAADPLVERVVAESAGSPFLIEQLSAYLREPEAAAHPVGLADAVLGQVDRLGTAARAVAELISVAGGALDLAQLLRLAEAPEAMRWVYRLRDQRILRTMATRPKSVEIYHDRLREALLAALPAARRARLHRQVADVLRQRAASPELLLEHLLGAGDRAGAAEAALAAAQRSVAALAFARAAELFALAAELRGRGDADWMLLGRHGEALANAGLGGAAGRAFAAAAAAAQRAGASAAEILTLRAAAARELLCAGELAEGTAALSAMLAAAGLSYPRRPLTALARLLLARARIAARGLAFVPAAEAAATPAALARIDACWAATVGLNSFDAVRSAAFQAQHTLLALAAGETMRVVRALTVEAVYRAAEGGARGRARSAALIERVDQLADALDEPRARGFARLCAGVASYFAGEWARAVERLADAERVFRDLFGVGWEINNCWTYRLWAFAWMGELDRLLVAQREASAEAAGREDALAVIGSASGHANLVWLVADRPEEARARATAAIAPFPRDTFQSPHYADFVAQMRIDLYTGDAWAAWRRQRETLPRLRRMQLLRLQLFRVEVWSLVASAALAACAAGPAPRDLTSWNRRRLLRAAARATARLRREDLPAARALADALDAARAVHTGARPDFAAVAEALARHGLGLYAAAARYRAEAARGLPPHARTPWRGVHAAPRLAAMLLPVPGD
jgi:hypothetical protein